MDKVLSARLDETAVEGISGLARRLRTSKKRVIDMAVTVLARQTDLTGQDDAFAQTFGLWKRREGPHRTAARAREAIRASPDVPCGIRFA